MPREPWHAAGHCWEALWLVGPLRETLRVALGQPKRALSHNYMPSQGTAGVPVSARPCTKDICKLGDAVTAMIGALSNLAARLQDKPSCDMNMAREVVTEPSRTIHKDQESCKQLSLEHEYEQLQAREAELEAAAVKSVDLENVVSQLRLRVSELEAQESRVSDLRYECRTLRSRIAELIGSTLDLRTLEHEHAELTRELEFQQQQQQQQQVGLHVKDGGATPSPLPEITGNYV